MIKKINKKKRNESLMTKQILEYKKFLKKIIVHQ